MDILFVLENLIYNVFGPDNIGCNEGCRAGENAGSRFFSAVFVCKETCVAAGIFYEHVTIRNTDFIPSSEALVRREVKYIYWPDFKYEELFDLKNDPHEEHNLASDPKQAKNLDMLRQRFAELKTAAK